MARETIARIKGPTATHLVSGRCLPAVADLVRGLLKETLESFGYTVLAAVDGEDAVRAFREHQDAIRLLLFDIIMPVKNGIAEEIRFVAKPVAPSLLLRKVRETLDTGESSPA